MIMGEYFIVQSCNNVAKYWNDNIRHDWCVLKQLKIMNVKNIRFEIDRHGFQKLIILYKFSLYRPVRILLKKGVRI